MARFTKLSQLRRLVTRVDAHRVHRGIHSATSPSPLTLSGLDATDRLTLLASVSLSASLLWLSSSSSVDQLDTSTSTPTIINPSSSFNHILSLTYAHCDAAATAAAAAARDPSSPKVPLVGDDYDPKSKVKSKVKSKTKSDPLISSSSSSSNAVNGLSRYAVADAVDKVLPSVVNIRRVTSARPSRGFFGWDGGLGFGGGEEDALQVSCGSGFFIDAEGTILTNAHVVASPLGDDDTESILHVTLSDGELYVGRILAMDEASDIALVKIHVDRPTPFADMGDSDSVRPGEFVVAVGSPLTLSNSVSFGIISMIRRDLFHSHSPPPPPPPPPSGGQQHSPRNQQRQQHQHGYMPVSMSDPIPSGLTYLQLDVAINQGSSGGPCVSLDGTVIGMCSMKLAGDAEGIAFAIPIHYASRVVADLKQFGYVRRPYVGLTLISVTPQLFDEIRMDNSYRPARWLESHMRTLNSAKSVGLMVHHIFPKGPGDRAGLKPGDVIIEVNESQTLTTSEFLAALAFNVNRECKLTVRRAATGVKDYVTITPEALNSVQRPYR